MTLTMSGAGTQTLSGASTYSGGTTLSAGTLTIGASSTPSTAGSTVTSGPLGTGTLTLSGGTLTYSNAAITIANPIAVTASTTTNITALSTNNLTLNGNITGSGTLTENSGSFSVLLGGNNSGFTGSYNHTATGATVFLATNSASASAPWTMSTSGGRFMADGASGTYSLGALSGVAGGLVENLANINSIFSIGALNTNTTFAGTIQNNTGTVAITKVGTGSLTLSGTNTYTGSTTISAGILDITATGALPSFNTNGGYSVANGATLAVYNAVTDANIASMLATTNFAAGAALGFDTTTANRTYSTVLADTAQGALGLTKLGANTLNLTGANTYTGVTTINAGILSTGTTGSLATSGTPSASSIGQSTSVAANLVLGGGTLQYANTGAAESTDRLFTITGGTTTSALDASGTNSITYSNTGAIAFSGSNTTQTLTLTGSGAGVLDPILGNNGSGATSLTMSGAGTWTLNAANTYTGTTNINAGTLVLGNATNTLLSTGTVNFGGSATLNIGSTSQTLSALTVGVGNFTDAITGSGGTLNVTSTSNNLIIGNGTGSAQTSSLSLTGVAATFAPGSTIFVADQTSSSQVITTGTLTLGAGTTLNAGNITLAFTNYTGGGFSPGAIGTLTINSGATLNVSTLTMQNVNHNNNTQTAILNLNTGGTLFLGTLSTGAAQNQTTNTINFNGGTIENFNSSTNLTINALNGTNSFVLGASGNPTFDITSGRTGTINQAMSGSGSLTKIDSGTLITSVVNTYTGTTTVSGGALTVSGAGTIATSTGLSVSSGAQFNYLPTTTGTMTLATGSTLNLAAGSTVGLAFGDEVAVAGAATSSGTATSPVYLNLSGAFTSGTTYTVLGAASGLTGGAYVVNNPTNFTYTVAQNGTNVQVTPTTATALTTEYWLGTLPGSLGVWAASDGSANSNWASASTGTATPLVPGSTANVVFSATGAANQGSMTLGSNMAINSLTVNGTTVSPNETNNLVLANTGGYTLTIGNSTLVATPGITVNAGSGIVTLNSNIALGIAQTWTNNSTNALTVNGAVTGAFGLTTAGSGTLNLSGTSLGFTGGLTVSNGTLNISNNASATSIGTFTIGNVNSTADTATLGVSSGNFAFGGNNWVGATVTGARGVLNISGTANVTLSSNFLMVGSDNGGVTAAGVVNQTGGTLNLGGSGALLGWAGDTHAYAGYVLSGGILNLTGTQFTVGNQGTPNSFYSQSGGTANFSNNFYLSFNTSSTSVADISGGSLTHSTAGNFMSVNQFGAAGGTGILTVRGTGTLTEQTGNFFVTGVNGSATGIVNLLSGGTIVANRIQKVASASAKATINFDGGTLQAYSTNAGANFLAGLDNAFVYGGGLTVDNNSTSITIGQALAPPTGFGIGADGSTIPVASGGSGYIAPPVVTFAAPASGVAATGVAVLSGGVVTGIIITSPGSGYTNGQSVAVTFNGGSNTSNAAVTVATPPTVTAGMLNTSGGLTLTGAGITTLSGPNTYTGGTTIGAGTLSVATIADSGASNIGPSSGATNNILTLGGGTLQYTGAGTSTTGRNVSLTANGTVVVSGGALSNLVLNGTLSGGGFGLTLGAGSNGTLTLGGSSNSYTGPTTVNAGTLNLTGSLASTTAAVASGATLSGTGSMNSAALTVNGGGTVSLAAASQFTSLSAGSLTLGTAGTYNSTNYATLNFSYGAGGIESLNGLGSLTSNNVFVSSNGLPTSNTYTLLQLPSATTLNNFSLSSSVPNTSTINVGRTVYTINDGATASALTLTVNSVANPGVAYWDGAVSTVWYDVSNPSLVNWSTDAAGATDAGNIPGPATDVILNASNNNANNTQGGTVTTTLGANLSINSLNVNGNSTHTISAGNTLTINALADSNAASDSSYNGNPAGQGITIGSAANAFTINAGVTLGGSQQWTNGSANTFTVAGAVTGSATSGSQVVTLQNSSTGNTLISGSIGDGLNGGKLALTR